MWTNRKVYYPRFIGGYDANSGRGHKAQRSSKPDISGSIPKVADEICKMLKSKKGGLLNVKIRDGGGSSVYSMKLDNGSIKLDGREMDHKLRKLSDYLKSYGDISIEP